MNKRSGSSRGLGPRVQIPPQLRSTFICSKTVRFLANASVDSTIRAIDLADLLYVATSATTATSVIGGIRLKRLRVWSPAEVGAAINVEFVQNTTTFIGSPSIRFNDRCVSTAYPAYVECSPPENSLSGFWISGSATSTGSVVNLDLSDGSVVDLSLEIVLLDSEAGQALTIAGGVPGTLALKTLCGGTLVPDNFPTFG